MTDSLLAAFEIAKKGDGDEAFASLEPHFARHAEVVESLVSADNKPSFTNELRYRARRAVRPFDTRGSTVAAAADVKGRDRLVWRTAFVAAVYRRAEIERRERPTYGFAAADRNGR